MITKLRQLLCLFILGLILAVPCFASELNSEAAENVTSIKLLTDSSGFFNTKAIFDNNQMSGNLSKENARITLTYDDGIGSIYLLFRQRNQPLTVTNHDTGESRTVGEDLFLHEFVDLTVLFGTSPHSVTVQFGTEPVYLAELTVFTPGEVPDSVQKWNPPVEGEADLLLLSAHSDDEQIFFAGTIPYYGVHKGYNVQVVYVCDHHNFEAYRVHEMLDGLWAVGLRTYPVIGNFPDYKTEYSSAMNNHYGKINYAYRFYQSRGITRDDLVAFTVEQLRRFKPKVAITHDFAGEYGHSQHMVCADVLAEAVSVSMDPSKFSEQLDIYDVWDVPKTYIHLYEENPIVLDCLDTPLECFKGLTAYEVSKTIGFPCHKSQYQAVNRYLAPYKTAQEMKFSSASFGLLRSTVGEDVQRNDFFENVLTHAQQAQLDEQIRLEEEARLAEEARVAEEARIAEEARQAAEAQKAEEARLAAEAQKAEELRLAELSHRKRAAIAGICATLLLAVLAALVLLKRHKKRR